MTWCQQTSNIPGIFLFILFSLTVKPATLSPVATDINTIRDNYASSSSTQKEVENIQQSEKQGMLNDTPEEDDELFKDVDPRTLAAVLLEALNNPHKEKMTEREDKGGEEEKERDLQGADRDRDGHEELELVMAAAAAQGKEEREREEEEEKKRAEEEERLTEKVKSHTTSQTIPLKDPVAPQYAVTKDEVMKEEERQEPEKESLGEEEEQLSPEEVKNLETMFKEFQKKRAEEKDRLTEKVKSHTTSQTIPLKEPVAPQDAVTKDEVMKEEERQEPEKKSLGKEEEQLSPEEVKNLETMFEEFQSYSTATKRERDTSTGQRESRGEYFDYLDRNGLMNNEIKPKSKGNDLALSKKKFKWQLEQEKNRIQPPQRGGNFMDDFNNNFADPGDEGEEDQEEEELLSPEEEETRAKAEQEEVRRQAAEAQRAKAEEEKLADIASDMLLKYIVKQDKKKFQDGAEDKRSDEEDTSDDDDIDPQTIDKLIEISSKLHLPADDVVDIISDVEKKKKKDAPENLPWQRPLVPPPAPVATSTLLRKPPPLKPPQPNTSPLKSWFKDRVPVKPNKQDIWTRQQWPFLAYPSYNVFQKPYRGYYPIYIPPPKPKTHYYSKPAFSINDVLGNSLDYDFDYSSRRKARPWAQSRPRAPPAFQRNLYFPNYIVPQPRTFKSVPMPKPRSPPRLWPSFYYPARAPVVTRKDDYYSPLRQLPHGSEEDLENFIKRVFMKHPRMFQ